MIFNSFLLCKFAKKIYKNNGFLINYYLISEFSASPQGIGKARYGLHCNAIEVLKQRLDKETILFLHVNGKTLEDIGKHAKEYKRLAILCTTPEMEHLIAFPNLHPDQTAATQTRVIMEHLEHFEIAGKIVSVAFDTATSTLVGKKELVCVLKKN